MDSLSLSLGFGGSLDEEESAIEEQAEEALRSQHRRNFGSSSSRDGSRTPLERSMAYERPHLVTTAAPMPQAPTGPPKKKLGRPFGAKNKPKLITAAPLSPDASLHRSDDSSRKRSRAVVAAEEHSEFAPPPVATKGAYRLQASNGEEDRLDDLARSLSRLGVSRHEDRESFRAAVAPISAAPDLAGADHAEDSASFVRHHSVTVEELYGDPLACPCCEEHMTMTLQMAKYKRAKGGRIASKMNSATQQARERLSRAVQARSNLTDEDQKLHEVIYATEDALRGRVADKRIYRLVLLLKREFVEKRLEQAGIEYVPWTMPMIEAHYDPKNKHMWQPLRSAMRNLEMAEEQLEMAHAASKSGGSYDFRGMRAFKDAYGTVMAGRKEVNDMMDIADPNIAETIRLLSTAIFRSTCDTATLKLTQDPETAAGKIAASGDNRTSAGQQTTVDPHGHYALSHISAQ